MRLTRIIKILALCAAALMSGVAVNAAEVQTPVSATYDLNIPAQDLHSALQALALAAHQKLFYTSNLVIGKTSRTVKGSFTVEEAVRTLLAGTNLTYEFTSPQALVIRANSTTNNLAPADHMALATGEARNSSSSTDEQNPPQSEARSETSKGIEEIVVSAQKREERIMDVPVPVTAIDTSDLVNSNQLRLQEYYNRVPGLNVTPGGFHALQLTVRGLTTGGGNPTVGVVVDDVPYGSTKGTSFGLEAPDIDPGELQQVEVLRGPQGTLYGASSMGGLLKFVTVAPSTESFSGRVEAGFSGVENGRHLGFGARGAVNIPLSESFALRASAFSRRDPGYIDNLQTGERSINEADFHGGQVSALWRPTGVFQVRFNALYQRSDLGGSPEINRQSGLGDLEQSTVRGSGVYDKTIQAYSAVATADLGFATLTSVTGYNLNRFSDVVDFSAAVGPGSVVFERSRTAKFTQELRLTGELSERIDWLLGAFYTDEDADPVIQHLYYADRTTGALGTDIVYTNGPNTFTEHAAFANLTFRLTDRLDVQTGARQSENKQSYQSFNLRLPGSPAPQVQTEDDAFTYLVTPRFRFSPDLMIYGRFASGYRPGGPNTNVALFTLPNRQYQPDTTKNYELGVKGAFFDNALSLDLSVYHIDWDDIQVQVRTGGFSYYTNGGSAQSEGVELAFDTGSLAGFKLSGWLAWNDAALTEPFASTATVYGADGDHLPYSARFSANFSLDRDFVVSDDLTANVGASVSYLGDRLGVFRGVSAGVPLPRQDLPAYTKTDLRAGLETDSWSANFYVNNVFDKRGILQGGLGQTNPAAFYYIQPRTIGLSIVRSF